MSKSFAKNISSNFAAQSASVSDDLRNQSSSITVEVIAPSSAVVDFNLLRNAIDYWQKYTSQIIGLERAERSFQCFAGSDQARANDINLLADTSRPLADIIIALRGGYGATRLLPLLDYDRLRQCFADQTAIIVGHSDFTAIQMALYARAGIKTFSGPMLTTNFSAQPVNQIMHQNFWQMLTRDRHLIDLPMIDPPIIDAEVEGTLWGGNLAIIASLIGTPYMPQIDNGILYIEDINEQPYRIERMLDQLYYSGILLRQRALICGDFAGQVISNDDGGFDMHAVYQRIRQLTGLPVLTGLPYGHIPNFLTLPFGAHAKLKSGKYHLNNGFSIELSDYPVLSKKHYSVNLS